MLIFFILLHKPRLIKLTSPNLNYVTGVGAIILYIEVYLTVVQTKSQNTVSVLCNVRLLITCHCQGPKAL